MDGHSGIFSDASMRETGESGPRILRCRTEELGVGGGFSIGWFANGVVELHFCISESLEGIVL